MDWTAEAIDRLRALWADGHSTAEIGRRMGITKNAVVGKAHRLDLAARPSPIRRGATSATRPMAALRRPAPPAVAAHMAARPHSARAEPLRSGAATAFRPNPLVVVQAAPPAPPTAARAVTSLPLLVMRPFPRMTRRDCCWPMGDPGTAEFRFCSGEAIASKPYCHEHAAVAYVKARDRREDAA